MIKLQSKTWGSFKSAAQACIRKAICYNPKVIRNRKEVRLRPILFGASCRNPSIWQSDASKACHTDFMQVHTASKLIRSMTAECALYKLPSLDRRNRMKRIDLV